MLALRLCSDNSVDPVFTGEKVRRARIYWKSWVERAPFFDSSGGTGKKKGFFIAWVPDGARLYYRWADCKKVLLTYFREKGVRLQFAGFDTYRDAMDRLSQ